MFSIDFIPHIGNGITLYLVLVFNGAKNLVRGPDGQKFFLVNLEEFAMMGIWLRFALRSPRSTLLYIGVSISNAAENRRRNKEYLFGELFGEINYYFLICIVYAY